MTINRAEVVDLIVKIRGILSDHFGASIPAKPGVPRFTPAAREIAKLIAPTRTPRLELSEANVAKIVAAFDDVVPEWVPIAIRERYARAAITALQETNNG